MIHPDKLTDNISLYNDDCMNVMKIYPDRYFDIAIVDPQYGINAGSPSDKSGYVKQKNGSKIYLKSTSFKKKDWDNEIMPRIYFQELIRVSKHQIIWGINHQIHFLPKSCGRIVWDKLNGESDQYGCEIAYNSLNNRTDIVYYMWNGMMQGEVCSKSIRKAFKQQGNKKLNEKRIHPTQKPVKLYHWLLENYVNPSWKIIDTHLGSGSIMIAADILGIQLVGIEKEEDYYQDAQKRI